MFRRVLSAALALMILSCLPAITKAGPVEDAKAKAAFALTPAVLPACTCIEGGDCPCPGECRCGAREPHTAAKQTRTTCPDLEAAVQLGAPVPVQLADCRNGRCTAGACSGGSCSLPEGVSLVQTPPARGRPVAITGGCPGGGCQSGQCVSRKTQTRRDEGGGKHRFFRRGGGRCRGGQCGG